MRVTFRNSVRFMRMRMRVNAVPPKEFPDHSLALKIAEAMAIQICQRNKDSQACAVAWDTFDEFYTAILRREEKLREYDVLEAYCEDHPDDMECKIYDV